MSHDDRSLERAARSWLEAGPTQAPDRAVDAALHRIRTVPQERDLRIPWRKPTVLNSRFATLVALAAALAVVIVGAILVSGRQGPQPTPVVPPSASVGPSSAVSPTSGATPAESPAALNLGGRVDVELASLGVSGLVCGGPGGEGASFGRLDIGPDHNVYVLGIGSRDKAEVLVLSPTGTLVRRWTTTVSVDTVATDVAVGPDGTVYLALGSHGGPGVAQIQAYSPAGKLLRSFATIGLGEDQLQDAAQVAVSPDGTVDVLDDAFGVIKQYRPDGTYLDTVGHLGFDPGGMSGMVMERVGSDGTLYVVGAVQVARIQAWSANGTYLWSFGSEGRGPGQLDTPADLAFGPNGSLYILDTTRIQAFDAAHQAVGQFAIPPTSVRSIASDGSHLWFCGAQSSTSILGRYDLP